MFTFVILRLELCVCIMMAFKFCEMNYIYIYMYKYLTLSPPVQNNIKTFVWPSGKSIYRHVFTDTSSCYFTNNTCGHHRPVGMMSLSNNSPIHGYGVSDQLPRQRPLWVTAHETRWRRQNDRHLHTERLIVSWQDSLHDSRNHWYKVFCQRTDFTHELYSRQP